MYALWAYKYALKHTLVCLRHTYAQSMLTIWPKSPKTCFKYALRTDCKKKRLIAKEMAHFQFCFFQTVFATKRKETSCFETDLETY
jgi:hypothetical protein